MLYLVFEEDLETHGPWEICFDHHLDSKLVIASWRSMIPRPPIAFWAQQSIYCTLAIILCIAPTQRKLQNLVHILLIILVELAQMETKYHREDIKTYFTIVVLSATKRCIIIQYVSFLLILHKRNSSASLVSSLRPNGVPNNLVRS